MQFLWELCDTEFIKIPVANFPAELMWNTDDKHNIKLNA